MTKLLFISTNEIWSGSEELWTRYAISLKNCGCEIHTCTKYHKQFVTQIGNTHTNYFSIVIPSFIKRVFWKLKIIKNTGERSIFYFIKKLIPDLIIISQGNNFESIEIMNFCVENKMPFCTITQLVTEEHYFAFRDNALKQYQLVYAKAVKNFFVSKKNIELNNIMLGINLNNVEQVLNPCRVFNHALIPFPDTKICYIGLVGRIEFHHKGYDILLQVIANAKWQERNVIFNIYGDGPHLKLLNDNISRLKISNVVVKGFVDNISEIWQINHLLCMPSRMEGQALALIEAMYFGRTVVATNVGGAEELINDNETGFLAAAPTVEALDEALERAWNKRYDWERMGALCHDRIENLYNIPAEEYLNSRIQSCFKNNAS